MAAALPSVSSPLVSLVVCCFNEEEALPGLFPLLDRLAAALAERGRALEVVLVDDGSTDRTAAIAAAWAGDRADRRLVAHPRNRGFGAALRTGFSAARGGVFVCYDADATYPIEDALRLLDEVDRGADAAGATPFTEGGEAAAGPVREALSRGVAALYRLALRGRRGVVLTAPTCAFRAIRREALHGIEWRADGFLAAAEIAARLTIAGRRVVEIPSRLSKRTAGRSKMRVVRTGAAHLAFVLRAALRGGDLAPAPAGRGDSR